jgi:p-hydroxybenzoate 3-monooxygenase
MNTLSTQVAIIGGGPSGLLLAQLLHLQGIGCIVIETKSREYLEQRIRAGVLEAGTVATLHEAGAAARLQQQGLVHHGIKLRFEERTHLIDFKSLINQSVTVYGQHEVVKDLIEQRTQQNLPLYFECSEVQMQGIDSESPSVNFTHAGERYCINARFIAGCDGFHGISRPALELGAHEIFDKTYPFAWLGILAEAAPTSEELIYAHHPRGFALYSMRSPQITRLYIQCEPEADVADWPDDKLWAELELRLGEHINRGKIIQKSVTPMRSFVAARMQRGALFLAGDAAHIVPPTGAKGMNLAVADVRVLAKAMTQFFLQSDDRLLKRYTEVCLDRIWRVEQFSWHMTSMFHRFEGLSPFEERMQIAQLENLVRSQAAATALSEHYVGLPLEI